MDIALKRLYISMFIPGVFVLLIWLVFIVDISLRLDLVYHGLFPRKISGLQGIIFGPFIHGGIRHIFANSIPLFALSALLFYFYQKISLKVLMISYLLPGVLVWLIGRPAYHVGASGIIYGLAGFLFISGILRKHLGLMAISFLVAFQYGSMIWGIFPIEDHISWESHLTGLLTGLGIAWYYRDQGSRGGRFFWEAHENAEEEETGSDPPDDLPWREYEIEGPLKKPNDSYGPDRSEST